MNKKDRGLVEGILSATCQWPWYRRDRTVDPGDLARFAARMEIVQRKTIAALRRLSAVGLRPHVDAEDDEPTAEDAVRELEETIGRMRSGAER